VINNVILYVREALVLNASLELGAWSLADWDCSLCSCPSRPTLGPFSKLGHSRLLLRSFKSIFWGLFDPPSDAVDWLQETIDI